MDTMVYKKFEHSSTTNFMDGQISTPVPFYPSLFDNTINPIEALTPKSLDGDCHYNNSLSEISTLEKKPVKKRKSWGQQLPEPKTNLPPRKRAKTEDEKEQRRVERVLRNRRAAQSSRERKRQEVEALEAEKRAIERKNVDLEMQLADLQAKYHILQQELERFGSCSKTIFQSYSGTPTSDSSKLRQKSPITFSMELFKSQEETKWPVSPRSVSSRLSGTVDPATLSPESRISVDSSNATSSDMIQHPAAVLCDLQCQSKVDQPWMNLIQKNSIIITQLSVTIYLITISEVFLRSLVPASQISMFSRMESYLFQTLSALNLSLWMVFKMAPSMNLLSATTLMMKPSIWNSNIQIKLLLQLLACSPNLARPIMDATMVALRSESKQPCVRGPFFLSSLNFLKDISSRIKSLISVPLKILSILRDQKLKVKFPTLSVMRNTKPSY